MEVLFNFVSYSFNIFYINNILLCISDNCTLLICDVNFTSINEGGAEDVIINI